MSSRSVSDTKTQAESESLYIRYRSDAKVLSYLKNDPSYEFIGEVNFKNKHCLSRENQSWSLCKSGQIFIQFTNID
jgi:hypothetical protein